jgi:hypothetical protein
MLPPSSPWRWRQHDPLIWRYPTKKLHDIRTQKTWTWIFTFLQTSDLMSYLSFQETDMDLPFYTINPTGPSDMTFCILHCSLHWKELLLCTTKFHSKHFLIVTRKGHKLQLWLEVKKCFIKLTLHSGWTTHVERTGKNRFTKQTVNCKLKENIHW